MIKKMYLALILLSIIITACSTVYVCQDASKVKDPSLCKSVSKENNAPIGCTTNIQCGNSQYCDTNNGWVCRDNKVDVCGLNPEADGC